MSRKATEKSPEVDVVIAQIREYLNKNSMSTLALAKVANASQSALFRFLSGERKSVTEVAKRCMAVIQEEKSQNNWHNNYVNNSIGTSRDRCSIDGLIESIKRGDHGSIEMAVSLLNRLKPVLDLFAMTHDA